MEQDMSSSFHTRLAIIEKDLAQLTQFLSKLEGTMEKLSLVLSSLKETIVLHDLKLTNHEKIENNDNAAIKEVVKRIDSLEQFRWYAAGAVAFLIAILPIIYKLVFKL